jgi:putative ABC transport system permease protein
MNLLKSGQGERRTAMYGVAGRSSRRARTSRPSSPRPGADARLLRHVRRALPARPGLDRGRRQGAAPTSSVLSRELAEKLYGDANPVGQRLT